MAQSFLDIPGLPRGLRNNNPGNLRPLSGGTKWQGELEPDSGNFSRFQDIAWGLRAMITDITGDIMLDGNDTLRKLITAYSPPGENSTAAYIATVSAQTGLQPDQKIPVTEEWIRKIIKAKVGVELGGNYASRISSADYNEAFARLSDRVKQWLSYTGSGDTEGWLIILLIATAGYVALK